MPRRHFVYTAYGLLVAASLALAAARPLLFQKLNLIQPAESIPELEAPPDGPIDIEAVLRPIPLHGRPTSWVEPATRHLRTMIEGGGNCSQIVFGYAYQLERDGVDYQIIHMMTSTGLEIGDGHTVIRIPYVYRDDARVGLVDLSFGALLVGDKGGLDVADIEAAPVPGWGYLPLNDNARLPDYHEDFLVEAALGYISSSDVRRYYEFLDRVYFSLGSERLEKYFFDGLALIFGVLPAVRVPEYEELMGPHQGARILHRGSLWTLRSALLGIPSILGFELLRRRRS